MIKPEFQIVLFPHNITAQLGSPQLSLNPNLSCLSENENDWLLSCFYFTMKMMATRIWRNTLVPRSPDRWHVPVRACPQLSAAAQQRGAAARQSTHPLHSIRHQNYTTNMLLFSRGSGEYAITAYLHHLLFQSNKTECLEKLGNKLKKKNERPHL